LKQQVNYLNFAKVQSLYLLKIKAVEMDSQDIARYIEETNGISKPWLLVQLRLKKLQERRATLSQQEYIQELDDIQQDLMKLGEWWQGIEGEVFKP
jgi:hypothetical protein